jgi:protein-disulfide isomerase
MFQMPRKLPIRSRAVCASLALAALFATGMALGQAFAPVWASGPTDKAPVVLAQAAPSAPSTQATPAPEVFNADQKAAIEKIVKEYFLKNPEAFLEIQTALEAKMENIQAEKMKTALKENAADIFKRQSSPVAGNPKGDITVVEFFDYNCGYCRKAYGDIAKLVDSDSKIKLVLKELPILTKGSEEASRVAIAAKMQGRYWDVHRALITLRGEANEQTALKVVEKLGLDMTRLKKDMQSDEVKQEISFVRQLAHKMGIQGTPHFLVGDHVIPGAPGNLLEQISDYVTDLRKNGCSVC